jgi:rsbT co-antagonist protein RsbR
MRLSERESGTTDMEVPTVIPQLIDAHHETLLAEWLKCQRRDGAFGRGQISAAGLTEQGTRFLAELRRGTASGQFDDIMTQEWDPTRSVLDDVSTDRIAQGFSSSETATFVFSLKEPLFSLLGEEIGADAARLRTEVWTATKLLDKLGLYTVQSYQQSREAIISRQEQELLELSTPVIHLWDAILALPLIGTLDSARAQTVMDGLLEAIVATHAQFAIIDITGVPTVDTLVAQHLIQTIAAARLMGADCIISGIRPQIAQTIVHLGVDLTVSSKATMAEAFAMALRRVGKAVVDRA